MDFSHKVLTRILYFLCLIHVSQQGTYGNISFLLPVHVRSYMYRQLAYIVPYSSTFCPSARDHFPGSQRIELSASVRKFHPRQLLFSCFAKNKNKPQTEATEQVPIIENDRARAYSHQNSGSPRSFHEV